MSQRSRTQGCKSRIKTKPSPKIFWRNLLQRTKIPPQVAGYPFTIIPYHLDRNRIESTSETNEASLCAWVIDWYTTRIESNRIQCPFRNQTTGPTCPHYHEPWAFPPCYTDICSCFALRVGFGRIQRLLESTLPTSLTGCRPYP